MHCFRFFCAGMVHYPSLGFYYYLFPYNNDIFCMFSCTSNQNLEEEKHTSYPNSFDTYAVGTVRLGEY